MNLNDLTLFSMLERSISYHARRQAVLAENVANADTPGYRPRDVQSFAEVLADSGFGRMEPRVTHAGHLAGGGNAQATGRPMDDVYEIAPSGNEVVLEQQLLAINENAMQHDLTLRLLEKHRRMIQTALGRSGR